MSVMNSSRVAWWSRKTPNIALVATKEFCFSTPRMRMQRCSPSTTTATPSGLSTSMRSWAICFVMRSWTWRRREYTSTIRASFEMPTILPFGM